MSPISKLACVRVWAVIVEFISVGLRKKRLSPPKGKEALKRKSEWQNRNLVADTAVL
jgi:hypothetical protein